MKICILTAGKGTRMGIVDKNINKALLPIKDKAIISNIIEFFSPDDEFVIGLGYCGQQVRDYLTVAYPDRLFHFVNIENFDGPGSGPGFSLLSCKKHLMEPFYFIPCDCLFDADFQSVPNGNWVGAKKVDPSLSQNYCNFLVRDSIVLDIKDKEKCDEKYLAFTGFLHVRDYDIFWKSLENPVAVKGEHQISNGLNGLIEGPGLFAVEMNWTDLGDLEKYENAKKSESDYNFEKTDEFIYFVNNQVIKFFADSKMVTDRVKKSRMKPKIFPKVTGRGEQFYSYPFFKGDTFYSCGNIELFKKLLIWLDKSLWITKDLDTNKMESLCKKFYFEKTMSRLKLFKEKNPNYVYPTKINGQSISSIEELLERIPWNSLYSGIPTFIHGDLQFDNILYNEGIDKFLLIDWRQDFAGETEFGDLNYDLAKLLGGIFINYDYIKKGLFRYSEKEGEKQFDFARRLSTIEFENALNQYFISKGIDVKKINLLTGLIFLNMSPLHHKPFNFILFALGMQIIHNNINSE
jgi:CTP:phosphocholine cytidylyltransferase-like protein